MVDLRVQQPLNYPTLNVDVDRTKAEQGGFSESDVAHSMLNSLSGSFQIAPMFFLNYHNGVNYNLVAQTPQYRMQSIQDLPNIPINASANQTRKSWAIWRASTAVTRWRSCRTTTSAAWWISTARCRAAIWARWHGTSSGS